MSGDLAFPSAPGRVPAIVLMHGCSGLPHRAIQGWEPLLREWGYATFIVDSFGPRGYREVCTNGAVSPSHRVPDAYGALAILSTHPRIDPDRIVLMGFSHGGPSCGARVEQYPRIVVPLRVHTGEKDDWTPAAPCVESVARYRAEGADVAITAYPDAPHGFDAVGSTISYQPNVLNGSGVGWC